jgi:hypothetical protein
MAVLGNENTGFLIRVRARAQKVSYGSNPEKKAIL